MININTPEAFSATTVNMFTDDSTLDTHLFLFSGTGAPIYASDDAGGLGFGSTLPAGSAFGPIAAGRYLLGIAQSGIDAVNAVNQLLFGNISTTLDLRGAASGLQPAATGSYRIDLTGAFTAVTPVPEPSVWLMLAVGVAGIPVLNRRRRAAGRTSRSAA